MFIWICTLRGSTKHRNIYIYICIYISFILVFGPRLDTPSGRDPQFEKHCSTAFNFHKRPYLLLFYGQRFICVRWHQHATARWPRRCLASRRFVQNGVQRRQICRDHKQYHFSWCCKKKKTIATAARLCKRLRVPIFCFVFPRRYLNFNRRVGMINNKNEASGTESDSEVRLV